MPDYNSAGILAQLRDRDYKIKIDSPFQEELERWRKEHLNPFAQSAVDYNPFKPVFLPWWQYGAPATIRDDKVVIHVKKRNIKFNFKD